MSKFESLLFSEKLKLVENLKERSVYDISSEFEIPRRLAYLFKFRFGKFNQDEISKIDLIENEFNHEVICAISFYPYDIREKLLENISTITEASNPFDKMDEIISLVTLPSPLATLSKNYWEVISDYLEQRGINEYPFNKKAISFIKSIGYKGFEKQTEGQIKWLIGLMRIDKKGNFDLNDIFSNEILIAKGLEKDYKIIKEYLECL